MAKRESGRLMLESEIPAFVDAVIGAGCDICAIATTVTFSATSRKWTPQPTSSTASMKRSGTGISSCWQLSHILAPSAYTWSQAHPRGIGRTITKRTDELSVQG